MRRGRDGDAEPTSTGTCRGNDDGSSSPAAVHDNGKASGYSLCAGIDTTFDSRIDVTIVVAADAAPNIDTGTSTGWCHSAGGITSTVPANPTAVVDDDAPDVEHSPGGQRALAALSAAAGHRPPDTRILGAGRGLSDPERRGQVPGIARREGL
jgi:hypothetical protein